MPKTLSNPAGDLVPNEIAMAVPNQINKTALPMATQTRQIPKIKAMPKKSSATVAARRAYKYDYPSGHGSPEKRKSELGNAAPISYSHGNRVRRCGSPLGSHEGNLQQFKSAANLVSAQ